MICYLIPTLKDNLIVRNLRKFFSSIYYMAFIALISAVSNAFALEIPIYYVYTLCIILISLFADDTLAFAPMVACAYMTVAPGNNPAVNPSSIFALPSGKINFAIIISLIALCLITRFIFDVVFRKDRSLKGRGAPKLMFGFIALGLVYILGGLFGNAYDLTTSSYLKASTYNFKSVVYGGAQIGALCLFYFYFFYTVDWKNLPESYFEKLMICVGFLMIANVVRMYFNPDVFTSSGVKRGSLYQGWGNYNNVGGLAAMTIPAPFALATKGKKPLGSFVLGTLFLFNTYFTHSRGAMLFGSVVYAMSILVMLIKSPRKTRIITGFGMLGAFAFCLAVCLIFPSFIKNVFINVIDKGMDDSGRFTIYLNGLKQFIANPIFGNGFYECTAYSYGDMPSFIPPRYHNTIVQILACCGIVGFVGYLFHRVQTGLLLFKKPSISKTFIALCICGMLFTSLLDCHFFNFGPGLIYSVLLMLAEGEDIKQKTLQIENE